MENDGSGSGTMPFSYDILDQEAAKITSLVSAVQQKRIEAGDGVAAELYRWAEDCASKGRREEAEFLYLHCINMWERQHGVIYPIMFTSLRDYAKSLLERAQSQIAPEALPTAPAIHHRAEQGEMEAAA